MHKKAYYCRGAMLNCKPGSQKRPWVMVFIYLLSPMSLASDDFSLNALLQQVYQSNLDLQSKRHILEQGSASEKVAFKQLLPDINLSASRTENLSPNDSGDATYSGGITLSQPLYNPNSWYGWKKSQLQKLQASQSFQREKQLLTFQAKSAWYQYLAAIELLEESKLSLQRLRQHQLNAEQLYATGKIWRNDVLQADVRVSRGEQAVLSATNQLTLSQSQLNVLMHRDLLTKINTSEKLAYVHFEFDLGVALQDALRGRLDLANAELEVNSAKHDVSISQSAFLPTLGLNLSRNTNSLNSDFSNGVMDTRLSINMNWSLWNWGARNNRITAAQSGVQLKNIAQKKLRDQIALEVQMAWLAFNEARKNLDVFDQSMSQSLENFRVSQIRYKEQLGSSNDVLDAQDLLTQNKTGKLSALQQYLTSAAQLQLAIGR